MKLSLICVSVLALALPCVSFSKTFLLRKGDHSSSINAGLVTSTAMNFNARFNNSAIYHLGSVDQYDINKLYGFSDCYSQHQTNSARFGWTWNEDNNTLEIHAYTYAKGNRDSKLIGVARINQTYSYRINVNKDKYEFYFDNKKVVMSRGCNAQRIHGYQLFPYFGGNQVAPQDITIDIN